MKNKINHSYILLFNFFLSVFFGSSKICQAQENEINDSVYHERLYYTCKAWGFTKYFHSEVKSCKVNWDLTLINSLEGLKKASNHINFNDSLLTMLQKAGEMEIPTTPFNDVPDFLKLNLNLNWQKDTFYSSEVINFMDTVKKRFRQGPHCLINPMSYDPFVNDSLFLNTSGSFPDVNIRILSLFRYWNTIKYYFAYHYLSDNNWDDALKEFIPQIVEASNSLEYVLAFKRLSTKLNDGYTFFYNPTFDQFIGTHHTPFYLKYVEDKTVIKVALKSTGVKTGDIVKKLDGINIESYRDSLFPYSFGSNDVGYQNRLNELLCKGDQGPFSIEIENKDGSKVFQLNRHIENLDSLREIKKIAWRDTLINGGCKYGIVDMEIFKTNQVDSMFHDLWDAEAIIFDIRSYPNGAGGIFNYLFKSPTWFRSFTARNDNYPGVFTWVQDKIGQGTDDPFPGRIVVLFDEETFSFAESYCMAFEKFPNTTKIGSQTAGANGDAARIRLPGNIVTLFTSAGEYYPDGRETQRIGIIPDIRIKPTIEGLQQGRDEVLEKALECVLGENKFAKTKPLELSVYPIPAREILNYQLISKNYSNLTITIFDLSNRIIKKWNTDLPEGKINVHNFPQGFYIIQIQNSQEKWTKKFIIE